jgi:5-(carboxyamino)imidazole ribonucleotide synthase
MVPFSFMNLLKIFIKNQILKHSKIPAEINDKIFKEALESAKKLQKNLDYVGTMCVEYFINQNNESFSK